MQSNTADPKPSPPKAERKNSSGLSASSPRFGYPPFAPAVSSFLNKAKDLAHDFTHKEKRRSGGQGRQGEQAPNTVNEPAVQGAANDGFGKNPYESGLAGRQKEVESMGGSSTIAEMRPTQGENIPIEAGESRRSGDVGGAEAALTTVTPTEMNSSATGPENVEPGFASQVNKELDSKFGGGSGGQPASTAGFGEPGHVGGELSEHKRSSEGVIPYRGDPAFGGQGVAEMGGVNIPHAAQASAHGGTGFSP